MTVHEITVQWVPIAIAISALWFTFRADRRGEKIMRMNAMPHLDAFSDLAHEGSTISFEFRNNGLGPAVVRSASFQLEKATFPMTDGGALNQLFGELGFKTSGTTLSSGTVIPPGESRRIVTFSDLDSSAIEQLREHFRKVGFTIEYESWYGDRLSETERSLVR